MDLLERYIKELTEDLKIDEMNIKDVQMRLPSRKHFWAARLINHRISLEKQKNERDKLRRELISKVADNAPIKLSQSSIEKTVDASDDLGEVRLGIREHELIIELLEKAEKNFSSLTYDIKNIIELMKLEQL